MAKAKLPTINFTITAEQDHADVRGNAMASGDPVFDREAEDAIIAAVNAGNVWAWCHVKVRASLDYGGYTFFGEAQLGCCSYASEQDFRNDGYYEDMQQEALAALRAHVAETAKAGKAAEKLHGLLLVAMADVMRGAK